ncbi:cyclic nucleotide-binding domain-containing protein [Varunaivibrio sulfuroxidans]|uniref:Cyclic nucleotide-binding protein n=1 Tax=Varunaivibrio sulfuroxidans TaxID=1773489 RepID=A0A4R3JG69_9PROT|nr:cyclic nucleotide-binding domain-containing protein [Varunaivibrio sulfuroxidans]TCS64892.1 cyclic nucleotide-binding protein [Varunaivibrio sulfuroxidans]WES29813.1 cyclic nucleotide-binding domain-containing protein [Varunaivibrio sulfuroxidans]
MAKAGWTQSTFEVLTGKGARWIIETSTQKRSEAMETAENFVASGEYAGVRVTELRDGWKTERVIFERSVMLNEKPLKVGQLTSAEPCQRLMDYYRFPARLVIGRVARAYLDRHGITALELLFNRPHLNALERMDGFYVGAMQAVATVQARQNDEKPADRLDVLYRAAQKIRARARDSEKAQVHCALLGERGLDTALKKIKASTPEKEWDYHAYAMLAMFLSGSNWRQKIRALIELLETTANDLSLRYVDEALGEILDGGEALRDIFGAPPTAIDAWRVFIQVTSGHYRAPKYAPEELDILTEAFAHHDLPISRKILLGRVAQGLGGVRPLTREGRDSDRKDFISLVRDLVEPAGMLGGPPMSEAVVLRAKVLLGDEGADLPIDTAVRQALYLMPTQAARLGVLLDLTGSDLGKKYEDVVRAQFSQLVAQLRTIYDLFPESVADAERLTGIDSLRERLGMSVMSHELKRAFTLSLGKIADALAPKNSAAASSPRRALVGTSARVSTKKPAADPAEKDATKKNPTNGKLRLAQGAILFCEGEPGDEAYLIVSGTIDIFRTRSDGEQLLASVGRGELIGEMSLIDSQPRMASARANADTELIVVSQDDLTDRLAILQENDKVLHFLITTLTRRLRGLARVTE